MSHPGCAGRHTLVVWISEVSTGPHGYADWPVVLFRGGGGLRMGRYVSYAADQPCPTTAIRGPNKPASVGPSHNQLLVSLCHAMALTDVTSVGATSVPAGGGGTLDCTGPLPGLV